MARLVEAGPFRALEGPGPWSSSEEGWLGGLGLVLAALAALAGYLVVSMVVSTLHWRDFWIVAAVVATLARRKPPGRATLQ